MNIKKLSKLFEASTDKYGDARKMGTTYQNINNILQGADLKVSTLEGIAKFYNVPVGYFFDEAEADGRSSHEVEIANLKGQIKGLKEAIKILKNKEL
jgi:transcriptional regulator with XRE-family HTH domain